MKLKGFVKYSFKKGSLFLGSNIDRIQSFVNSYLITITYHDIINDNLCCAAETLNEKKLHKQKQ